MHLDMTQSPFAADGHWLKAALHTHSTVSDGWLTPEDLLAAHQRMGYQLVAFTDHHAVAPLPEPPAGVVVLTGVELTVPLGERSPHLVGLHLANPWPAGRKPQSLAEARDWLADSAGFWFLAHPGWSDLTTADLLAVEDLPAIEVYNSGCRLEIGRGYATYPWDAALSRGRRLGGLAVDDAHQAEHLGVGWTIVRAPRPTAEAAVAALAAGHYYASEGPVIEDLRFDAATGTLSVRCSPAQAVYFICRSAKGLACIAEPGSPRTEAAWPVDADCGYVRVEVVDPSGRRAWSGAFRVDPAGTP